MPVTITPPIDQIYNMVMYNKDQLDRKISVLESRIVELEEYIKKSASTKGEMPIVNAKPLKNK